MKLCFFSRQTQSVLTIPKELENCQFNFDSFVSGLKYEDFIYVDDLNKLDDEDIKDFIETCGIYFGYWTKDVSRVNRRFCYRNGLFIFYCQGFSLDTHFAYNPELLNA